MSVNRSKVKGRRLGSLFLFIALAVPSVILLAQGGAWSGRNLGGTVNSIANDFGPIISADGNYLLFTSDRMGFGGQDFWACKRVGGEWQPAANMGSSLNTEQNEGPDTFSVDKRTLYFTGCDRDGGRGKCDIYFTRITDEGKWAPPVNLGYPINTEYDEANASLSADGRYLFFASVRPGNVGGELTYKVNVRRKTETGEIVTEQKEKDNWDIWVSEWIGEGWSEPRNMGTNINTPRGEEVPFIHSGGETIYFSSNGHGGFGGFDIFMTKLEMGVWKPAENLGPTINTKYHETYLTVPGSGDLAYLSAWREGGNGKLDLYVAPLPVQFRPRQIIIVMGKVYDVETKEPLSAVIRLEFLETAKEVAIVSSDKRSGRYEVALPVGARYMVSASTPGYMFFSKKFEVPKGMAFKIVRQDIPLQPVKKDLTIVLENIYFDFNKSTLRPESKGEINRLTRFMNDNPSIVVEISGHTDSVGSSSYNMRLSRSRAQSVVNELLRYGIPAGRVIAKGYGYNKPRELEQRVKQKQANGDGRSISSITRSIIKETNRTSEGRQLNRRVEFKILRIE